MTVGDFIRAGLPLEAEIVVPAVNGGYWPADGVRLLLMHDRGNCLEECIGESCKCSDWGKHAGPAVKKIMAVID